MPKPSSTTSGGTAAPSARRRLCARQHGSAGARGVSLDAQQVRIRAHCISQDLDLVDPIIDDGYSAKSLERPGIKQALAMLTAKKADAIVVVKLDRLTRSVKDLGRCSMATSARGLPWSLLSVSDSIDTRSAGGKLLLNADVGCAVGTRGHQRAHAGSDERTQAPRHPHGGAGYGWQWSQEPDASGRKQLIPHPEEQATVARICDLYRQGLGIRTIALQLDREGVPARKSRRWGAAAPDDLPHPRP